MEETVVHDMRAGFGKFELTPPLGVELAGYGYYLGRCGEYVSDPLYARALMMEDGDEKSLVISCELLGLSKAVCAEVIAFAAGYGLKPEDVIIVSVHTHNGPCIKYHEGCGFADDAYVATVAGKICRAVEAAAADMAAVTALRYTQRPMEGDYIYNRAAENGPVDRMLRGLRLVREGAKDIIAASAACHGVFNGRTPEISADFAGEVNRQIEAQGCESIYLNGLCGDIDPWQATKERRAAFAAQIADTSLAGEIELPLTIRTGRIPFTLKLTPVEEKDIRAAAAAAVERNGGPDQPASRVALTWEKEMLEKLDWLSCEEEIEVKWLLLGGLPVLAFPFEGFTRIGMDVRASIGREDSLMLGCAEELLGYLPTRDDIHRGAYAALESTFLYKRLPVVPGEAERLAEEVGAAFERILS